MMADKKQMTRLLKTARGQLDGILKMVEEDRYCIDISNQLMATQSILSKANAAILQAHMAHCVSAAMDSDDEAVKKEKLDEIAQLLQKLAK
ncbi:MAG: metal-sensing transcriptional repressor [Oscillospiraceae bacterium]|nr:metal-sensing transcriptional repressor [Oscillospiraceae bacterium]